MYPDSQRLEDISSIRNAMRQLCKHAPKICEFPLSMPITGDYSTAIMHTLVRILVVSLVNYALCK